MELRDELVGYIKSGAETVLRPLFMTVSAIFLGVFLILIFHGMLGVYGQFIPFAFISGGLLAGLCSFFSCRFSAGAGVVTVREALKIGKIISAGTFFAALSGLAGWYLALDAELTEVCITLMAYWMGAALVALFVRLGGGLFAKAADICADSVGYEEANLGEDDLRNPASISDVIGDHVGDVAGGVANSFAVYTGVVLATMTMGASIAMMTLEPVLLHKVFNPLLMAAGALLFSLVSVWLLPEKPLMSMVLNALLTVSLAMGLVGWNLMQAATLIPLTIGLLGGIAISWLTRYWVQHTPAPDDGIPASLLLRGLSAGLRSTGTIWMVLATVMVVSYLATGGADHILFGIFGVCYAAVGMAAHFGIWLSYHLVSPLSDAGVALRRMTGQPAESNTENTLSATLNQALTGLTFLTSLALFVIFLDTINYWARSTLDINAVIRIFQIDLANPFFLAGVAMGVVAIFFLCGMMIRAVERVASELVPVVRAQLINPTIWTGEELPDYLGTLRLLIRSAKRMMIALPLLVLALPVAVGGLFQVAGLSGFLLGAMITGCVLATVSIVAGTQLSGMGGLADGLGDPLKDVVGPSLNMIVTLLMVAAILGIGIVFKVGG